MFGFVSRFGLLVSVAIAASCATSSDVTVPSEDALVWPVAPEPPRIAFINEFSNLAELGVRPSIWGRIVSFTAGKKADAMVRPMAIAVSLDEDLIFVADPDANCVHRYELSRGRHDCLTVKDSDAPWSPVGLAVDDENRVFASDSQSGEIYAVDESGKWLEPIQLDLKLKRPTGLFWDSDRKWLYVVDTARQSLSVFTRDGALIRDFVDRGDDSGQLNYPTYVWVSADGEVLVTDSLNFRVQVFDQDGKFVRKFGVAGDMAGDFARPKGIATDGFGHIYVVDALFNALQVFDPDGMLLLSIGRRGHQSGEFWLPNGIFITKSNTIFVADSYNKRVQVFRYVGTDT